MPISTRKFVTSTLAMLALGFLALCAIEASTIWLGERARSLSEDVIAARDLKAVAVDLRAAVQTAESSQRGFLYTGNAVYLAPYDLVKARAKSAEAALTPMLDPYPQLRAADGRLKQAIDGKLQEMDQTIAFALDGRNADALSLSRTNRGKLMMDEINLFVSGIVLAADQRLSDLVGEQTGNANWLRLVSIIGGAVIVLVVLIALFLVVNYTRALKLTQRALAGVNDRLEQQVALRTSELALANTDMRNARDRAEMLLSEVNHRVANSLTLVASLIGLQSRSLQNEAVTAALDETRARVQAIAMVHKRLYDARDVNDVALDEYLTGLLDQFKTTAGTANGISLHYEFEPLRLKTDSSVNLGIIVSEWVMNAFKYAYPDHHGPVRVFLSRQGDGFGVLRVEDDGIGRGDQAKVRGTGLGTRIVAAMAKSMDATIDYVGLSPGTMARLSFPLTTP